MKTVFQKKFDKLRTELKPDIKGFNSKLRSKGLITHEVWSKHDIDETLSAISGRLQNEDVTVRTFTEFSDAVSEISSHLKSMLSKALSKELKEEPVFSTPSYATPLSLNILKVPIRLLAVPLATSLDPLCRLLILSNPVRHGQKNQHFENVQR